MYRIILAVIVVVAVAKALGRYQQDQMSLRRFIAWTCLWGVALIVGMMPQSWDYFSRLLGVETAANFFFFFSILFLVFLVFNMYVRIDHLHKDLTKLVRELALKEMGTEGPVDTP